MGDRVAVMRKGELQQVDAPQELYDQPGQPLRRRLHRQPGHEHARGDARAQANGGSPSRLGSQRLALGEETLSARPALQAIRGGKPSFSGSGPSISRTPRSPPTRPADRRLRGEVELTEALGSEIMVHFAVDAPPALTEDVRELAQDAGDERVGAGGRRRPRRRRSSDASAPARSSSTETASRLAVDTSAAPFLRPRDGARDLRRGHERSQLMRRHRCHLLALAAGARARRARGRVRRRRRRGGAATGRQRHRSRRGAGGASGRDLGHGASGPAPEQKNRSRRCIDGFTEQNPDVDVNVHVGRRPAADRALDSGRGRQPARHGGSPAAGARPATSSDENALQPIDFAQDDRRRRTSASRSSISGRSTGRSTAFLFKAANKSTVWYNVQALRRTPASSPPKTGTTSSRTRETIKASGLPAYSIGGADGWTLTDLFENIYLRTAGAGHVRPALHARDPVDRSVGQGRADRDGQDRRRRRTTSPAGRAARSRPTSRPRSANVFADSPKAAEVIEGDFVPGVVESTAQAGDRLQRLPVSRPSTTRRASVVGGGDTRRHVQGLARGGGVRRVPDDAGGGARSGPSSGGFAARTRISTRASTRTRSRQTTAGAIAEAETFRFDLSDLQPAEFGGTVGQGLCKLFQDFLQNPDDVDGIAQQMEAAAAKAYGN